MVEMVKKTVNFVLTVSNVIDAIKNIFVFTVVTFIFAGSIYVYFWHIRPLVDTLSKQVASLEQSIHATRESVDRYVQASKEFTFALAKHTPTLESLEGKMQGIADTARELTISSDKLLKTSEKISTSLTSFKSGAQNLGRQGKESAENFLKEYLPFNE